MTCGNISKIYKRRASIWSPSFLTYMGKATVEKLLSKFKSVKKIREATNEELSEVLNKAQLASLKEYFSNN